VAVGIKPIGSYVFVEPVEDTRINAQRGPEQLIIASVVAAGPDAKGIRGNVLVRAGALSEATTFNSYVLVSAYDVVASLD